MNDKVKQLLENAEQSDAIAINKWRIENREQLRKERKQKLKELMEKDKQQTAVSWFLDQLLKDGYIKRLPVLQLQQAKEMEKKQIIEAFDFGDYCVDLPEGGWKQKYDSPEQYYNETFGGGEQ
jgi:hypothetical protein